jgi:hypothetical protein
MKSLRTILSTMVLTFLLFVASDQSVVHSYHPHETPISQDLSIDCENTLEQFAQPEDWFEQLVNPVITTDQQLSDRLYLYSRVHKCLEGIDDPEIFALENLVELFLDFAGGFLTPEEDTSLTITTFADSMNPAIVKIRDEAGVPIPEGYIFVRTYSSREIMPPMVRRSFEQEDVVGVTIYYRYVAVLDESSDKWQQQVMDEKIVPETIAHELIHAYVNSTIGYTPDDLPKWYSEGLAIFFSGGGNGHSLITEDSYYYSLPPEDYREYYENFQFLDKKIGHEEFLKRIKQSIVKTDPQLLYQGLGIVDYEDLVKNSKAGLVRYRFVKMAIFAGGFIFVFILIMVLFNRTTCVNCNYRASKKKFESGYCPKCHKRYDIPLPDEHYFEH